MLSSRLLRTPVQQSATPPGVSRSTSSSGSVISAQSEQSAEPVEPQLSKLTMAQVISDISALMATSNISVAEEVLSLPSSAERAPEAKNEWVQQAKDIFMRQAAIADRQAQLQSSSRGVNGQSPRSALPAVVNGIARNGGTQPQDALEVTVVEIERKVSMMLDRMAQAGLDIERH